VKRVDALFHHVCRRFGSSAIGSWDAVSEGRAEAGAGESRRGKNTTVFAEHSSILPGRKSVPDTRSANAESDFGPYRFYVEPLSGAEPELLFKRIQLDEP